MVRPSATSNGGQGVLGVPQFGGVPEHGPQAGGDDRGPGGIGQDGLEGHPAGLAAVGPDGQGQIDQQEGQPTGQPTEIDPLGGGEQAQEFAAAGDQGQDECAGRRRHRRWSFWLGAWQFSVHKWHSLLKIVSLAVKQPERPLKTGIHVHPTARQQSTYPTVRFAQHRWQVCC